MYMFYLGLFVILLIAEGLTVNLVTIWMAIAALVTSVYAYFFNDMYTVQAIIFILLSIVLIALTKPFVKKVKTKKISTNSDRFIGETGIVTQEIDDNDYVGLVKVKGQIWSACSLNGEKIEKNKKVTIHRIEGVKLIVSEVKEEELCR